MKEYVYTVAVTGHRPNKLYGYDLESKRYQNMKQWMKDFLIEKIKPNSTLQAVSGMALGVDQLFALAVIELKNEGFPIMLHCAIPCKNHECKWPKQGQELYHKILDQADTVHLVTDAPYQPYLMNKRNEYMVNMADEVLAIWDGSKGGTGNCVNYAKKKEKKITLINPNDF